MLGTVNSIFVLLALRRNDPMTGWKEAVPPLLLGLALAMFELAAVGTARAALEAWLGPPWS
jgi:hypothetical protein